ncbi:9613_t:CDS:2, partial [Cetraspora pellucida]
LTTYFPKMSTSSRLICDNIENANLVPEDLLSDGIVNGVLLKKYHKPIFNVIKNYNCINELYSYDSDIFKVKLDNYQKKFIDLRIKHGYATMQNLRNDDKKFYNALGSFLTQLELVWKMPLYQQKSPNLNERSYTHQVVKNWGHSGPSRLPDVMISKKYKGSNHKWEFGFSEVSYAPYSFEEDHYFEDMTRLAKFSKDDWNHGLKYITSYDIPEAKDIWDQFNHIMIHFHKTTMDIYVLDCEMKPFHRMILIKSTEIPLLNNNGNLIIEQVCNLCESILFANNLVFENIRKIDSINQLMAGKSPVTSKMPE